MTPRDLCFWLSGFLEKHTHDVLTHNDRRTIQNQFISCMKHINANPDNYTDSVEAKFVRDISFIFGYANWYLNAVNVMLKRMRLDLAYVINDNKTEEVTKKYHKDLEDLMSYTDHVREPYDPSYRC